MLRFAVHFGSLPHSMIVTQIAALKIFTSASGSRNFQAKAIS